MAEDFKHFFMYLLVTCAAFENCALINWSICSLDVCLSSLCSGHESFDEQLVKTSFHSVLSLGFGSCFPLMCRSFFHAIPFIIPVQLHPEQLESCLESNYLCLRVYYFFSKKDVRYLNN
jgi:hypothetical protein